MNKNKGFTLIEILIALSIFSILALTTASLMYHAFQTEAKIKKHHYPYQRLQIVDSLLSQDLLTVLPKVVYSDTGTYFPAFIGQTSYFEFTQSNPLSSASSAKPLSRAKRIAYLCQGKRLIRRIWMDTHKMHRDSYQDKVLVEHLSQCQFSYLDKNLDLLSSWAEAGPQKATIEILPKAIHLQLSFQENNMLALLYPLGAHA